MGLIAKLLLNRYTGIAAVAFTIGAFAGSGVMSKSKQYDPVFNVKDNQGIEYKVNVEEHSIQKLNYNKKEVEGKIKYLK